MIDVLTMQLLKKYLQDHGCDCDLTLYLKKTEVPEWAKQPEKPTYSSEDIGALSSDGGVVSGDIDMSGNAITNVKTPTKDTDAANKKFVSDLVDSFFEDVLKKYVSDEDNKVKDYVDAIISFNEIGELKVTINGVSKTYSQAALLNEFQDIHTGKIYQIGVESGVLFLEEKNT